MLTETAIRSAKSRERLYKLFDERELYLRSLRRLAAACGASDIGLGEKRSSSRSAHILMCRCGALERSVMKLAGLPVTESIQNIQREADEASLCPTFEIVALKWS